MLESLYDTKGEGDRWIYLTVAIAQEIYTLLVLCYIYYLLIVSL